jgi:Zn-dependent M28 family amino/carboxypeptidase
VLGVALAGVASVGRGATVPGASDNATGVAVLLDLARALAAAPPEAVDVVLVFPGTEEAGMGGMRAALEHPWLDPARVPPMVVVGVDTLGGGTPIVAHAEGTMRTQRFDRAALALVARGAAEAGVPAPEPWRIGGWTDPVLAQHRGIPSTCLLSVGPGYYTEYHLPTDTADRVDWGSVMACAAIVAGTVAAATADAGTEVPASSSGSPPPSRDGGEP